MTESKKGFEEFLKNTRRRAYSFALRLTRNKDDAEDLLQEAVVRAFRAFDPVDGQKHPEAWIKQIILNCFLDQRRSKMRRPSTCSLQFLQEENPNFDAQDARPDPEQSLLAKDFSEPISKALERLTDEQREIILTSLFQEESQIVLAERFGCHAVTFKTRLHRAHRSLRRQLLAIDPGFARPARSAFA